MAPNESPSARLLIAERDPKTLGALSWLLREQGYDVVAPPPSASPPSDRELLAVVERSRPDLLLLDVDDLGSDGDTFVRRMRDDARARDLPIIVTGSTTSPGDPAARGGSARSLPGAAADDCVVKPLRVNELLARIETQLRSRGELRRTREALREAAEQLERAREDIANKRQLVDILHEVTGEMAAGEIYRILARRVARALDITHCSVVLATAGDTVGIVAAAFEDPTVADFEIRLARYPEITSAIESGRPVLVKDAGTDPLFAGIRAVWSSETLQVPLRSVVTLPFMVDRRRSGVLFLRTERSERALTEDDVDFADVVIKAAVAAIKRAQALEVTRADNRRLEELATRDSLTRLLNRRALLERLAAEVDRARRFKSTLTLLLLDLDHFKAINDGSGHLAGDDVLRQIALLLDGAARTVDVVSRYGGEEFVVILPETSQEGGVIFAERLRERIERHAFDVGVDEPLHLTASIGVATFPSTRVESTEDLFARADEALYRAKSNGRNQVRT